MRPGQPSPEEAWRSHVPDVTAEEVAALLPIVRAGHGRLRGLVLAFRTGRASAALTAGFLPAGEPEPCPLHWITGDGGVAVATPELACAACCAWVQAQYVDTADPSVCSGCGAVWTDTGPMVP